MCNVHILLKEHSNAGRKRVLRGESGEGEGQAGRQEATQMVSKCTRDRSLISIQGASWSGPLDDPWEAGGGPHTHSLHLVL